MIDLTNIRGVIADLDGVVWRGSQVLAGAKELFAFLAEQDIPYVFASNNSTRTPHEYIGKIAQAGIAVQEHQIINSAIATAAYLRAHYPNTKTVFLIGEAGLQQALEAHGFQITTEPADFVVAGLDRSLTYEKLRAAAYQLQGGAIFIGTNGDTSFPEQEGLAPGAGSILAAVEATLGQKPLIIGKPERPMFEHALSVLSHEPSKVLMIGDRLNTDILGAKHAGLASALVLTGVTTAETVSKSEIKPDAVYADLPALLADWR